MYKPHITSPEMIEEHNALAQNASIEDEALAFAGTMSPERESWQMPASTPQDNKRVVDSNPKICRDSITAAKYT